MFQCSNNFRHNMWVCKLCKSKSPFFAVQHSLPITLCPLKPLEHWNKTLTILILYNIIYNKNNNLAFCKFPCSVLLVNLDPPQHWNIVINQALTSKNSVISKLFWNKNHDKNTPLEQNIPRVPLVNRRWNKTFWNKINLALHLSQTLSAKNILAETILILEAVS